MKKKKPPSASLSEHIRKGRGRILMSYKWQNYMEMMKRRGYSEPLAAALYYSKVFSSHAERDILNESPYFRYPNLSIGESHSYISSSQNYRNRDSLLSEIGYSYAEITNHLKTHNRQFLEEAFTMKLDGRFSRFSRDWGRPFSPTRLRKIAWTMASVIKDAKRRGVSSNTGFLKYWVDDFYYMKDKYYDDINRRLIYWPS